MKRMLSSSFGESKKFNCEQINFQAYMSVRNCSGSVYIFLGFILCSVLRYDADQVWLFYFYGWTDQTKLETHIEQ